MPPRKTRSVKSSAPSPSPALSNSSGRSSRSKKGNQPEPEEDVVVETSADESVDETEPETGDVTGEVERTEEKSKGKGKGKGKEEKAVVEELPKGGMADAPAMEDAAEEAREDVVETEEAEEEVVPAIPGVHDEGKGKSTMSMEERLQKMKDLRIRMNQSTAANRKDLVADHQKQKVTARDLARLEKQKKLAQTLRLKAEAEENGEDIERKKNWEYSIEQNERWEAKLELQKITGDSSFHNAEDDAHKLYNRNIRSTKPDLETYERQKSGISSSTIASGSNTNPQSKGLTASENLYRGAETLAYGDHKPDEDAVDRVMGKINKDLDKKKKKKRDETEDEVTYINQRNKVFNKKIARYFDKYTKEIRANFERGTAL